MRSIYYFFFRPATVIAYMLQSTEYQVWPYLRWFWRTQDFSRVMHRRHLEPTKRAQLLRGALQLGMVMQVALGIALIGAALIHKDYPEFYSFGAAVLLSYPVVWAHVVVLPLLAVRLLVVDPKDHQAIAESEAIFTNHKGAKIAVAGSYGKTTMKELLLTVLSEGKKVAATPGNKNVAVSHAVFARKLDGDEDILVIEYGEGEPGDVARFARTTHPTHAIITGLAPAHLDKYGTLERAAEDIFCLAEHVLSKKVYVNIEVPAALPYVKKDFNQYDQHGLKGWKVSDVKVTLDGTRFTLKSAKTSLKLHSGLLGRHQIGPLSAVAVLALELGLTTKQVETGIAKTTSFEHRMQPYPLGGAWIIDDSYNGNLEGVRAGTVLLAELKATRKWYVTPGLVEQGSGTAAIHTEVGRLIAAAKPDIVVLMQNSVTEHIKAGLEEAGYKGDLRIESDPLNFYTNLDQYIAAGDVVLMQNDWTDNYA